MVVIEKNDHCFNFHIFRAVLTFFLLFGVLSFIGFGLLNMLQLMEFTLVFYNLETYN